MSRRPARALLAALALWMVTASEAPGEAPADVPEEARVAGDLDASAEGPTAADPAVPRAGTYELPPIARVADFWLLDETGARAPLLGLDTGQVALVSLIYTHCPAACPAALSIVQQVDREVATRRDADGVCGRATSGDSSTTATPAASREDLESLSRDPRSSAER